MSAYFTYLIYGAIFLSVLLLVEGLFYLLAGPGSGVASPNRRLRMLVGGASREQVMVQLQRERPLMAGDEPRSPIEWFMVLVAQSGIRRSPRQVVMTMLLIGGAAALLLMLLFRNGLIAGPGAIVAGLVLPVLFLILMRRSRWKT